MQVIDGFEALDLMEREPVDGNDRPLNDIKIHRIIMHANPIAENEQV
jgi:peptidyl-prolyl cis-trans isomerase-like 3